MDYNVQASVPETDISTAANSNCGLSGDNIVQIVGIGAILTGLVCVLVIPSKNKVGLNCNIPASDEEVTLSVGLTIEPAEKPMSPKS